MKHSRLTALLTLLLAAACAAPAAQHLPLPAQDVTVTSPDLARIYCVREEPVVGLFANEIRFVEGTREIGLLTPGTFLCWERPGGRTLGHATYEAVSPNLGALDGLVDLNCQAGKAYFFNISVRKQDGKPVIEPLTEEEGRALVAKRKWAGKR